MENKEFFYLKKKAVDYPPTAEFSLDVRRPQPWDNNLFQHQNKLITIEVEYFGRGKKNCLENKYRYYMFYRKKIVNEKKYK